MINRSFTLVEFLLSFGIIVLIIGIILIQFKPINYFQDIRDTKRINDLSNLEMILNYLSLEDSNLESGISTTTIYISLPDISSTCSSWISQLPSLPSLWQYHCSANPTLVNGQGWLPIDFTTSTRSKLVKIENLPIDPINKPPYYYSFVVGGSYELTAKLEIRKAKNDGGVSDNYIELGTDKKLSLQVPQIIVRQKPNDLYVFLTDGLMGYWPFDEISGNIAKDYSGNVNNAIIFNDPQLVDGKVGKALSFDGVNDYLQIPSSSSLNLPGNKESIFLWIKHNSNYILGQSYRWNRRLFSTNWTFYDSNNSIYYVRNGNPNDNLYHLVGYTVLDTIVKTYKDGKFVTSTTRSVNAIGPASSYWWLGRVCSGSSCNLYYSGIIDEVRIYNRALSDQEIKALYEATK
ncbi:MAG: hypothetical protein KatS3mg094_147 [Candidatus Parcubacteria bacterium]|nr:MAG: hypothetical protein KatS3mg094_147 [Candidatus Parcubacteria bacterium]